MALQRGRQVAFGLAAGLIAGGAVALMGVRPDWLTASRTDITKLAMQGVFLFIVLALAIDHLFLAVAKWMPGSRPTAPSPSGESTAERMERIREEQQRQFAEQARLALVRANQIAATPAVAASQADQAMREESGSPESAKQTLAQVREEQLDALTCANQREAGAVRTAGAVPEEESDHQVVSSSSPGNDALQTSGADLIRERLEKARQAQQERLKEEAKAQAEQKRMRAVMAALASYAEVEAARAQRAAEEGARVRPGEELQSWVAAEARANQQLRAQQDAELAESLRRDREREEGKRRMEEEARVAEERKRAEEERRQKACEEAKLRRQQLREGLPAEPPAGREGTALITVRLPDSSTCRRAWHRTHTIDHLYQWVESMQAMEGGPRQYALVTSYPRRLLDRRDLGAKTIEEAGLYPQYLLAIEEVTF